MTSPLRSSKLTKKFLIGSPLLLIFSYAGRPKLDNLFMRGGDMLSKIMFSQVMQPSVGSFIQPAASDQLRQH